MKRFFFLVFIVFAVLIFAGSGVYITYGFKDFSRPNLGLFVVFDTDYRRIKAFSNVGIEFSYFKGNIGSEMYFEDPIKYFIVDIDTVSFSYGYLKADMPDFLFVKPQDWVLKVGNSYVVFSDSNWICSYTGFLFYGVSFDGNWKVGFRVGDEVKGLSIYARKDGQRFFLINYGPIYIGNENDFYFRISSEYFQIGFDYNETEDFDFYGMVKSKNGYMFFKKDYFEFFERVGKVYAIGRFSKESKKVYIGYEFRF